MTNNSNKNCVEIKIPVKPYIKKYLVRRYGVSHKITKRSLVGFMLLELLNKDIHKHKKDNLNTATYSFLIGEHYFKVYGFTVQKEKINFLGNCLDRLFIEDFYNFVDLELEKGHLNAYQSVSLFLKVYKIPEKDLKHDSMYRKYQRYCNENIKQKKNIKRKLIQD